jgi:hypothetical protein
MRCNSASLITHARDQSANDEVRTHRFVVAIDPATFRLDESHAQDRIIPQQLIAAETRDPDHGLDNEDSDDAARNQKQHGEG